jgi:hypothetical protein
MYCKYCGADIPYDSGFCEKCGKKVGGAATSKETTPRTTTPETEDKKKKKKTLIIVLAILIPLIIIAALAVGLTALFRGCSSYQDTEPAAYREEGISFSRGNIYSNAKYGFKINYPDNWEYSEDEGDLDLWVDFYPTDDRTEALVNVWLIKNTRLSDDKIDELSDGMAQDGAEDKDCEIIDTVRKNGNVGGNSSREGTYEIKDKDGNRYTIKIIVVSQGDDTIIYIIFTPKGDEAGTILVEVMVQSGSVGKGKEEEPEDDLTCCGDTYNIPTPGTAYGVHIDGNYAYIADGEGLAIIDITDKENPHIIGVGCDTPGKASGVHIEGNYAYVTDGGLQIIDITDKENPHIIGDGCDTPGDAYGVNIEGNYAYIADGEGLTIIDITDKENPHIIGDGCDTPGDACGVHIEGNYAYVADGEGLTIIDVTDKENPRVIGDGCDTPGKARGVHIEGNYAYVADGDAGLTIIDVTDKENPHIIGVGCDTPGWSNDVYIEGNYAYVADGDAGLTIIDLRCDEKLKEEPKEEEEKEEEPKEEKQQEKAIPPTINIFIYEGPILEGSICYYRIRIDVSGTPTPKVIFTKDDSGGSLGPGKAQINLYSPDETYVITATATNSAGSATDTITLSWGCEIPKEPEPPDEESPVEEENRCPIIDSITYENEDYSYDYTFEVHVTDPDGDALTYSWSVSGGWIHWTDANRMGWEAETSHIWYITVEVSDGECSDSMTIEIDN